MPFESLEIIKALPAFALILFRISGLFLVAPVLSSSAIPVRTKASMILILAILVFPMAVKDVPTDLSFAAVIPALLVEAAIGAVVGMGFLLLASAAEFMGLIVGQQSGLALGEVFNPALEEQSSIMGQVLITAFMLVFLEAGGLRHMVGAVLDSYRAVPLMKSASTLQLAPMLIDLLTASFVAALRLSAPVLIALFLTETAMALISRTVPQLNILTFGFTVRSMLAIGAAALVISNSGEFIAKHFADGLALIRAALGLAP